METIFGLGSSLSQNYTLSPLGIPLIARKVGDVESVRRQFQRLDVNVEMNTS